MIGIMDMSVTVSNFIKYLESLPPETIVKCIKFTEFHMSYEGGGTVDFVDLDLTPSEYCNDHSTVSCYYNNDCNVLEIGIENE